MLAIYFSIVPRVSWLAYELTQTAVSLFGNDFIRENSHFHLTYFQNESAHEFINVEESPFLGHF